MTLVMLAITPVLAVMGFLISIWMTKATALINRAYADANSIAQQALGSVRTVYAFNAEGRTVEAYNEALQDPVRVRGCVCVCECVCICVGGCAARTGIRGRGWLQACWHCRPGSSPACQLRAHLRCCLLTSPNEPGPLQVGIKQGFISGVTVGATNCTAFCACEPAGDRQQAAQPEHA